MAEANIAPVLLSDGWNIPSSEQSGVISSVDRMIARRFKADALWVARPSEPRERALIHMLEETSARMGIQPVPKLIIYHSAWPNAASIPVTGNILFSTNLLDIMSPEQIRGIMGHELTHHKRRGFTAMVFLATLALWSFAYGAIASRMEKRFTVLQRSWLAWGGKEAIGCVGALPFLLWESRGEEYRADLGGSDVAGKEAMIGSLHTLHRRAEQIYREESRQGKRQWQKYIPQFLHSHPTEKQRVSNITSHASQGFTDRHLEKAVEQIPVPVR